MREIGQAVGLSSSSTVHMHLSKLEDMGDTPKTPTKPRTIIVLRTPDGQPYDAAHGEEGDSEETFDEMA